MISIKTYKRALISIVSLMMLLLSVIIVYADTTYESYGYQYTIINNFSVSLCGWDNRSPELIIPDLLNDRNVVDISNFGFQENKEITSVDFSKAKKLERIGMFAFSGCTGLSNDLMIPNTVKKMGVAAFEGCSSIQSITFDADMTAIPAQSFNKCSSLSTVNLPNYITTIGSYAFANCPNLTYLEIDKRVTNIADAGFYNDPNLCLGVWYDSAAYRYAINENINYILLDGAKLGDASGDGIVNINDVTVIQRYLAELETLDGVYLHAADANQDGTVDIADATIIQMYLAEYEMEYPIGEVMTQ